MALDNIEKGQHDERQDDAEYYLFPPLPLAESCRENGVPDGRDRLQLAHLRQRTGWHGERDSTEQTTC